MVASVIAIFSGGCKGGDAFTRVSDYAIWDGKIYMLLDRIEYVDHAAKFSHNTAAEITRRTLGIAVSPLLEGSDGGLQLLSKQEVAAGPLRYSDFFFLFKTNLVFADGGTQGRVSIPFVSGDAPQAIPLLEAKDLLFTTGRTFALGCGAPSWIVAADSSKPQTSGRLHGAITHLCDSWIGSRFGVVSLSSDLQTAVIRSDEIRVSSLSVVSFAMSPVTNTIALPSEDYKPVGVTGGTKDLRILFEVGIGDQRVVEMVDLGGKTMGRCKIAGRPESDATCSTIAAVADTQAMQLNNGERLPVKVWHPNSGKEFTLRLDTTKVLKGLE